MMQGLAWLLPVLDRPEHQRDIERLPIDAGIAQPTLAASLPNDRQAMDQRQHGHPAVKADRLTQQQPGHHLSQQHHMTLVAERAVLRQEANQLSMEPGVGNHWVLVWSENPNVSWLPAYPMT